LPEKAFILARDAEPGPEMVGPIEGMFQKWGFARSRSRMIDLVEGVALALCREMRPTGPVPGGVNSYPLRGPSAGRYAKLAPHYVWCSAGQTHAERRG